jgi:hypothetical protein
MYMHIRSGKKYFGFERQGKILNNSSTHRNNSYEGMKEGLEEYKKKQLKGRD